MTGWIRLTRQEIYGPVEKPVIVCVDHIQSFQEVTTPEGGTYTVLDMITGEIGVQESLDEVIVLITRASLNRT